MAGIGWIILGFFGGGITLLGAFLRLLTLSLRKQYSRASRREVFVLLIIAASFFGLIGVVRYGGELYRRDQEEAKKFVEQRIAAARAVTQGGAFPATQSEFVGNNPLPRVLHGKTFYFHDGGDQFHIEFRVDFDGGWLYSSAHPEWRRST